MPRLAILFTITASIASAACGGTGGSTELPASPLDPSGTNTANVTAPTPESPSDDAQLDSIRPTLRVTNATSTGGGSRSYEFQIADNSNFASTAGSVLTTFAVAVTQAGIPEGSDGRTSFTPAVDLLPSTRYYWRARAAAGSSIGPWSGSSRFRTKIDSFKSGNQAYDLLTNGRTVADQVRNISYASASDANPGCKLEGPDSFIRYQMATLSEGEVSFILRRVKPWDPSFSGQVKLLTMQDGTGDFNSNPFRVSVEKRPDPEQERIVLRWTAQGNHVTAQSGDLDWQDLRPFYFKLEWRSGTARLRVYLGENDAAPLFADVSTPYTGTYNPGSHNVIIGSLSNDSHRDIRASRVYIGPGPRPVS